MSLSIMIYLQNNSTYLFEIMKGYALQYLIERISVPSVNRDCYLHFPLLSCNVTD